MRFNFCRSPAKLDGGADYGMDALRYARLWSNATDHLAPDAIAELAEELGLEFDTPEHDALERSALCTGQPSRTRAPGMKRAVLTGAVKRVGT